MIRIAVLICFIVGTSIAESNTTKYKLVYKKITNDKINANIHYNIRATDKINFEEEPEYVSDPIYYIYNPISDTLINMVFDESKKGSGYDIVYVDLNNDNRITNNEKIKLNVLKNNRIRRNFYKTDNIETTIKIGNVEFPYNFCIMHYGYIRGRLSNQRNIRRTPRIYIYDKYWYTGVVNINNDKVKVATIFDALSYYETKNNANNKQKNQNGKRRFRRFPYRRVFIDINKNGSFDKYEIFNEGEELIVNKNSVILKFSNISENFKEVIYDVITTKLKFGTLKIENSENENSFTINYLSETSRNYRRPKRAIGKNGKCDIPVGTYNLLSYQIEKKDENQNTWELMIQNKRRGKNSPMKFTIEEDRTTNVKWANTIIMKVNIRKTRGKRGRIRGNYYSLALQYFDEKGNPLGITIRKDKKRVPPPKFSIVNEEGKTVHSGKFHYG